MAVKLACAKASLQNSYEKQELLALKTTDPVEKIGKGIEKWEKRI